MGSDPGVPLEVVQSDTEVIITGLIENGLNLVWVNYEGRGRVKRACLRLAAETALRQGSGFVRALDLQREGVLPWGTACGTMTELFESLAVALGGNAANGLISIMQGSENGAPPWSDKGWLDHLNARFGLGLDVDLDEDAHSDLWPATIRNLLFGVRHRPGDKKFLRANGWRPDFAYLHGSTSISKDRSPDGLDLAYRFNCPDPAFMYYRTQLLKHEDEIVRRIVAIHPV